ATNVSAMMFVDSGLTNGTGYYFRVRAQGAGGSSAPSHAVFAKPQGPPPASAPGNLTAIPGNAFITLKWNAVADATSYAIFRTTTGTFGTTPFVTVTGTTYKNTGLTNGTTYFYKVAGKNAGGLGPFSNEASAVPAAAPTAPTNVTATA